MDPDRPDKYNQTLLRCAAVEGHEEIVMLLLERKDISPNLPDASELTPLGVLILRGMKDWPSYCSNKTMLLEL